MPCKPMKFSLILLKKWNLLVPGILERWNPKIYLASLSQIGSFNNAMHCFRTMHCINVGAKFTELKRIF